jgi:hypothetical protein
MDWFITLRKDIREHSTNHKNPTYQDRSTSLVLRDKQKTTPQF